MRKFWMVVGSIVGILLLSAFMGAQGQDGRVEIPRGFIFKETIDSSELKIVDINIDTVKREAEPIPSRPLLPDEKISLRYTVEDNFWMVCAEVMKLQIVTDTSDYPKRRKLRDDMVLKDLSFGYAPLGDTILVRPKYSSDYCRYFTRRQVTTKPGRAIARVFSHKITNKLEKRESRPRGAS
jgi:hypothetical protein